VRILAVIRQVLNAEESVRVRDGAVDFSSATLVIDTMDEYGIEQALLMREAIPGIEVIVLSVGPARCEAALRGALAMGADRAILVLTDNSVGADSSLDAIAISSVVAEVARAENVELIFCGGQQADWDSHALGVATAERLGWPQATWTNTLSLDGTQLVGKHDVDSGSESFSVPLPAVVTTQQGLNDPRYLTLPNIMKARRKELRRESLDNFNVRPKLKILGVEVQVHERLRAMIDGTDAPAAAAQLVGLLRHQARVIQ